MTKLELIEQLKVRENWKINYMTFMFWEAKGFFKASNTAQYVGRTIPDYTEQDVIDIIGKLKSLNSQGLVRLRTYS